ncbi:MAG: DUF3298 domain-containing protein [Bacteroidota bacterium]
MKSQLLSCLALCLLASIFSCKNEAPKTEANVVTVGTLSLNKTEGADCDKPDSLRSDCITINLRWHNVEQGSESLKTSVSNWANSYIVGMIAPFQTDSSAAATTVEAAIQGFIQEQKTFMVDAEGSPMGQWTAESKDTVLLNDGKHLTLEIQGFVYAGGAHGSPTAAVATFDAATGKQLTWDDLVTDTVALKALAEKKYREVRTDIFKPTDGSEPFDFDDITVFALPLNYGLVKDGIYCHYLHYEVGPYAFGNTQMVIPFAELGALSKIKI